MQIITPNTVKGAEEDEDLGTFTPTWWRTYGAGLEEEGTSCLAADDGSIVVVGLTESYGAGNSDLWLMKTNETGEEQWNRTFGGSDYDFGTDVLQVAGGGYMVLGTTTSFGAGMMDAYLIKTDANGTEEWSKTYGGAKDDRGTAMAATADGGYVIAGYSASVTNGWTNVWVLKVNATGGEEWSADFGGQANDEGEAVIQAADGGFVVLGTTKTYGAGEGDVWVIKLNSTGGEEWNRTYGGAYDDLGNTVIQLSDGNILVSAQTRSFGAVNESFYGIRTDDIWLIKLDISGNELWNHTIGGPWYEYGDALLENPDGSLMVAGSTGTFQGEYFNIILIKTYQNGSVQWYKQLGGKDYEFGNDLAVTKEGNYIVTGSSMSYGAGGTDMVLMEFDPKPPAFVENEPPTVSITSPSDEDTVSGMLKVEGTANDDGYYTLIMIKFDNGSWITASEDKSWHFFWNTTRVTDGEHMIYARTYDGSQFSGNASVRVYTDNGIEPIDNTTDDDDDVKKDEEGDNQFLFAGFGVVIVIIILFIMIAVTRRKQKSS